MPLILVLLIVHYNRSLDFSSSRMLYCDDIGFFIWPGSKPFPLLAYFLLLQSYLFLFLLNGGLLLIYSFFTLKLLRSRVRLYHCTEWSIFIVKQCIKTNLLWAWLNKSRILEHTILLHVTLRQILWQTLVTIPKPIFRSITYNSQIASTFVNVWAITSYLHLHGGLLLSLNHSNRECPTAINPYCAGKKLFIRSLYIPSIKKPTKI